MNYVWHILILVFLYGTLASSANLAAGYSGMLSLAHAAFYGIGAYVSALMVLQWNCPFVLSWAGATVFSGLVGAIVIVPIWRIRDDGFAIATLAFQIVAFGVFNNWEKVTGGSLGLTGIQRPNILSW